MTGLGAAGQQVTQLILSEMPREQAAAAQAAIEQGYAQGAAQAASYVLEHPEFISRQMHRWPWIAFGVSAAFFAASLGYYMVKRSS